MNAQQRRLYWQCRRGMLELDELLHAFLLQNGFCLHEADHKVFVSLLRHSDDELARWLWLEPWQAPLGYRDVLAKIRAAGGKQLSDVRGVQGKNL